MGSFFWIFLGTVVPARPVHVAPSMTPQERPLVDRPHHSGIVEPVAEEVGRTRLLIGPTARSLERGEVYIDDLSVFFPSVQVGVTDRVSIGAGTPVFIPQTDLQPGDVVWMTPKVQLFDSGRTQGAVGVVHAIGKDANGGVAYAVATHGTKDTALTAGLGLAHPPGRGTHPVALVGAERRVSRRVKLLTENYITREGALLTGGLRLTRRNRTLDLAWFKFPGAPFYPIPLLRMTFQVSGRNK